MLLDAQTVVVLAEIKAHQVERGARSRLETERSAHRIHIAPVDLGIVEQIGRESVAVEVEARDPRGQGIADGHVDHALGLDAVVIAVFEFAPPGELAHFGLRGDDVDHARSRVAPEQRALRPTQHLDPLEVEIFGLEQARAEQRRSVGVDRGGAVAGDAHAQIADPANGEAGRGEIGFGEGDVGQRQLEVRRVLDLLGLQGLRVESADRDRDFLKALALALGGNDDGRRIDLRIFEIAVACRLRMSRNCERTGAQTGQ